MRKATMFTLALAISAIWLQAQAAGQAADKTSTTTTLEGCLQYIGGHYMVTDSSGNVHQLTQEANKLVHYVGKQVQVTGKPGVRTSDTTVQGDGSSVREQQVFRVKTVKQIADTCGPSAN